MDAEQARTAGMDIVSARHLEHPAPAIRHVGKPNRKRKMDQFLQRRLDWRQISLLLNWFLVHFGPSEAFACDLVSKDSSAGITEQRTLVI